MTFLLLKYQTLGDSVITFMTALKIISLFSFLFKTAATFYRTDFRGFKLGLHLDIKQTYFAHFQFDICILGYSQNRFRRRNAQKHITFLILSNFTAPYSPPCSVVAAVSLSS